MSKTQVIFRVFKQGGDVLALFPQEGYYEGKPNEQTVMSYQHVGQHGAADYVGCLQITRPAKPEEYQSLKRELESIGYDLQVRSRR